MELIYGKDSIMGTFNIVPDTDDCFAYVSEKMFRNRKDEFKRFTCVMFQLGLIGEMCDVVESREDFYGFMKRRYRRAYMQSLGKETR